MMAGIFRRTPDVDKLPLLSIGEDIGAIKDGTDTDGLIGHLILGFELFESVTRKSLFIISLSFISHTQLIGESSMQKDLQKLE